MHEPVNKLNELKTKYTTAYESVDETHSVASGQSGALDDDAHDGDAEVVLKSSRFLKMFSNLIYAREIRTSHDVFFDDVDFFEDRDDAMRRTERLEAIRSGDSKHIDQQKY